MLDHISISHQSGLVLWSRSFTPAFSTLSQTPSSPINALIRETFIEGRPSSENGIEKDGYSVRWTMENGLGLVFVVVFPALLPLTYVPSLLAKTKQLFLALFESYVRSLVDSLTDTMAASSALRVLQERLVVEKWEQIFERALRSCEGEGGRDRKPMSLQKQAQISAAAGASSPAESAVTAEEIAKNVQQLKSRLRRGKGKTPSPSPSPSKNASKLMRKWGDSTVSEQDMAALDYSSPADTAAPVDVSGLVSTEALGIKAADGTYEVADWDYRREALPTEEEILARATRGRVVDLSGDGDDAEGEEGSSRWTSLFSRLTGKKTLSKEDLRPVLAEMEKHLMSKNVAKDIAEKMCEAVAAALVGKKLGGLTSVKTEVQNSLSSALTRVLTPKTSTDLLLEIQRKKAAAIDIPDPYAITFVGVNGVGKSTNLSKVCFWLLQNGLRVLIAACDTFRSGAVEQLRVHVRNLGALSEESGGIELYERGYGKDAAGIAKDAIAYAKENKFDVVLIDTAGRMQDNEPLMRALAKLVTVNNPDKIVFVGEALVGNEAVDQLTKFDRSLKDFSSAGGSHRKRGIDGIILTKFDTIDDKVGAALSMTYVTGQPILFVGCGQTYTDLRHLKVNHIVQALLSD